MKTGTFRFHVGNFACLAILDGTFAYPPGLFFANLSREQYEPRLDTHGQQKGTIEVPYTCLYVDTGKERVLLDTGAGAFGPTTTGQLFHHLHEAGIEADDINFVVLSHGHPDHIGGILRENGTPAFRNARYVMLKQEWEYWQSNPTLAELRAEQWLKDLILSSARKNLPPIEKQLDLLSQAGSFLPGMSAIPAPGHTPGHMAVEIASAGERLVFVADAVLHVLDFEYPETRAVFDHQPGDMIATRSHLLNEAAAQQTALMASHLPFPGLGHVRRKGTAWEWAPIAAAR